MLTNYNARIHTPCQYIDINPNHFNAASTRHLTRQLVRQQDDILN